MITQHIPINYGKMSIDNIKLKQWSIKRKKYDRKWHLNNKKKLNPINCMDPDLNQGNYPLDIEDKKDNYTHNKLAEITYATQEQRQNTLLKSLNTLKSTLHQMGSNQNQLQIQKLKKNLLEQQQFMRISLTSIRNILKLAQMKQLIMNSQLVDGYIILSEKLQQQLCLIIKSIGNEQEMYKIENQS